MNPRDTDLEWLASNCPELAYTPADHRIDGELRFCAAFDRSSRQLMLGDTAQHRAMGTFLCDGFKVRIDLGRLGNNGWPAVYEVGGRRFDIAEQNQCAMVDLHFFEDGACCLSIKYTPERGLTLPRFILGLVIPFFYRLAYTDRYGLNSVKDDLWGEYPHGVAGEIEYEEEILQLDGNKPGRNRPCPCGSGSKYKRCHLEEVEAVKRRRLR